MNRNCLFGGALFAAGIVSGASAQNMTLSYSIVTTGALDYNIPEVMFDDFAGAGTFGPLNAVAGTSMGYALGTGTLLYAQSESDDNPATVALGAMFSYFTVDADGTATVTWDWTGGEIGTGQNNYWQLQDLTAGVTVGLVDLNAGGAVSGSMVLDVDSGVDYQWKAFAYATNDVSGMSVVSFEYAGCPCDIDGNETLNIDDVDAFVMAFIAGDLAADLDGNGSLTIDDVDAFVACFTAGCP